MLFYKVEAEMLNMQEIKDVQERETFAIGLQEKFDKFYQKHNKNTYMFVTNIKNNKIYTAAISKSNDIAESIVDDFFKIIGIKCKNISAEETTLISIDSLLRLSDRGRYISDEIEILKYFDLTEILGRYGRGMSFTENLITDIPSKQELVKKSDELLCGETLTSEVERIYKGTLKKIKFGHPVHYLIQTDDDEVREQMISVLITALYDNGRIHSKRFSSVNFNSNDSINFRGYESLYKSSYGGAIVIKYFSGDQDESEYAGLGTDLISQMCTVMKKYKNEVLTIFCFARSCEKTKNIFIEHLDATTIVQLGEEIVFGEKARKYLKQVAQNYGVTPDKILYKNVKDAKKGYLASNLNKEFDIWFSSRLKTNIYSQYAGLEAANKQLAKKKPWGSAYKELEKMIGLKEAKSVINQALDYYKAQKLFSDKGLKYDRTAMHMVFTGNPGTAKTTVARLFAQIMKDNGLLSVGDLYEVGRADLVGKYVGWTAPTVRGKFKTAKGSVLFIDEAYSLVDDKDGMYGDEAINTIVQEMENHREDIVVIFAGYPDKMESFLQKNPGLRSRIAYHVPFHDYDANELCQITELMAENKSLQLDLTVKDKLLRIFEDARKNNDFGNGRFVRNLFEKAKMKQASRLVAMGVDKVSKEDVIKFIADDFEVTPTPKYSVQRKAIGF